MGTRTHAPPPAAHPTTAHAHDDAKKALGPGVRPNTRSRLLEARERMRKRGAS